MTRTAHAILIALIALLTPFALAVTPDDKAALISEAEALIESQRAVDSAVAAYKSKLYKLKLEDPSLTDAWKSAVGWEAAQPLYRNLRDTMLGHLRDIEPTEPPVVIDPPDPPVDPDPIEPTAISIFIDAEGGPSWGNDTNDGMTAGSPVATIERAKIIAGEVSKATPGAVVAFRFRRGDTFGAFGPLNIIDPAYIDNPADWHHLRLYGTDDQPLVITGYGEGERPILVGNGIEFQRDQSNIEVRGIEVRGGYLVFGKGWGRNIKIIDCVGRNASTIIQADVGKRITNFEMRSCIVRDVLSDGSHRQGLFINRVDGWVVTDSVFYRCGWYSDLSVSNHGVVTDVDGVQLGVSIFNHGIYVTGDCSPGDCLRNVFLFNSGTGIQHRPGGNCRDNFVAFGARNGINWGATWGANSDDVPGTGEVTGNVIFNDTGLGAALTVGDIGEGLIADNLIVGGSMDEAVSITATHGPNFSGGTWFGINDLTVENNRMVGKLRLMSDGWGVIDGADGLLVRNNAMTGTVDRDTDNRTEAFVYADPNDKVVIENEAGQTGQVVNVTLPVMNAATLDPILSGEKSAEDLIAEYGGGQ